MARIFEAGLGDSESKRLADKRGWILKRAAGFLTLIGLAFIVLMGAAYLGWAQAPTDVGLTESPVYTKNCAKCHGKGAEGRHFGGPSLRADKVNAMSNEDLRNMISNGKGRMPAFAGKLAPEEIEALVRQIKALGK